MKIKDNFFVIDSNNFKSIQSEFYGFCLSNRSLDEITNDENFHKGLFDGSFVNVQVFDESIYISQDFIGHWGLYFFKKDGYWAISNSFLKILEHLSGKFQLTPNKEVMEDLMLKGQASSAYKETLVNEIELLPRNCSVKINKSNGSLEIIYKPLKLFGEMLDIDSKEGISALDMWYFKWVGYIRNLFNSTDKIQCDLSGGKDSRLSFLLLLCSKVDLSKVRFYSTNDTLHTHGDDYIIATDIAKKYGFTLNKEIDVERIPFSLYDTIDTSFYPKLGCHKQMYFKYNYAKEPVYAFNGNSGEMLRQYEFHSKNKMSRSLKRRNDKRKTKYDLSNSSKKQFEKSYKFLKENFEMDDRLFGHFWYKFTRMRYHFGRSCVEQFLGNVISLSPAEDLLVQRLKANYEMGDLIYAVIFERYRPELLDIKFDKNRVVSDEIRAKAREINSKYPFTNKEIFLPMNISFKERNFEPTDDGFEGELIEIRDNFQFTTQDVILSKYNPSTYCREVFLSDKTKDNFLKLFPKEIYDYADRFMRTHKYHPLEEAFAVMAVAKTLELINYKGDGKQ